MNPITAIYFTILLSIALSACAPSDKERNAALVAEWVERQLVIPDELVYTIKGDTIIYDPLDADYTIVAYIDSAGCTECRMKLAKWEEMIAQMNADADIDVNFLMVVETSDAREAVRVQKRGFFDYPLAIDTAGLFRNANAGFPEDERLHAFLVGPDAHVLAIGSPVLNPNLRKIYLTAAGVKNHVINNPLTAKLPMKSAGALAKEDSIVVSFSLRNSSSQPVEISGIVESCACSSAQSSAQTIPAESDVTISLTLHGDTATSRSSAEVYLADTDQPLLLKTISYAKKQTAAPQAAPNNPIN